MAGYAYLGMEIGLKQDWREILCADLKAPSNYKDQAKIEEYLLKKEAEIEEHATEYPLAMHIKAWVLLDSAAKPVADGVGANSFANTLLKAQNLQFLIGWDVKAKMKALTCQLIRDSQTVVPWFYWPTYGEQLKQSGPTLVDPGKILVAGVADLMDEVKAIESVLKLKLTDRTGPPLSQAKSALEAAKKLGLA